MASDRVERCAVCDEPTGRAGLHEDSLYLEDGYGPLCEACYESAITVAAALQDAS